MNWRIHGFVFWCHEQVIRLVSVPAWLIYLTATYTLDRQWRHREKPLGKTPKYFTWKGPSEAVKTSWGLSMGSLQRLWGHFEISFTWKDPSENVKTPWGLSKESFTATSLTVHTVHYFIIHKSNHVVLCKLI